MIWVRVQCISDPSLRRWPYRKKLWHVRCQGASHLAHHSHSSAQSCNMAVIFIKPLMSKQRLSELSWSIGLWELAQGQWRDSSFGSNFAWLHPNIVALRYKTVALWFFPKMCFIVSFSHSLIFHSFYYTFNKYLSNTWCHESRIVCWFQQSIVSFGSALCFNLFIHCYNWEVFFDLFT